MRYRIFYFLLIVLFVATVTPIFAQNDTLYLSLDDALNLAWKKSPAKQEASVDKRSGTLSLASGILGILPTPITSATYTKSKIPTTPLTPDVVTKTYTGSVGLSQVLFDANAFSNVVKGKLTNDYYRLQAKDKTANLIYSVKTSYYTLAKAYNFFDAATASLARATDNYNLVKEKFRLGQITQFDLLRSQTFESQAKINRITAEKNLKISAEDLKGQLGLDDNTILKPTTTPDAPNLDFDIDNFIADIFSKNPNLLSARKSKSIATTNHISAYANLIPSVNLFWESNYAESLLPKKTADWKNNDVITYGAGLNFPIFEIKSFLLNIFSTRNELKRADVSLRKAEILLRKSALNALFSYREAKENYQYASQNLELNRQLLQLAQQQYRLGAITQLDLFNTELNFDTAQNTYISALYDTYINYAQIQYLLGIVNDK